MHRCSWRGRLGRRRLCKLGDWLSAWAWCCSHRRSRISRPASLEAWPPIVRGVLADASAVGAVIAGSGSFKSTAVNAVRGAAGSDEGRAGVDRCRLPGVEVRYSPLPTMGSAGRLPFPSNGKQWMHDRDTFIYGASLWRRHTDSSDGWGFPLAGSPDPLQLREVGPAVVARTRRRRREAKWPARPTGLGSREISRAHPIVLTSRCQLATVLFTLAVSELRFGTGAVASDKWDGYSSTIRDI